MQINLAGISKSYQTNVEVIKALDNINLTVEGGSWLTITGPSGSGKTTLLRCLSSIEQPDVGTLTIGELDVMQSTDEERRTFRRENLGYVFQDFQLFDQFDVLTNVMIPLLPYQPRLVIEKRALELLKLVNLSDRSRHVPSQLSGGEKQRTAIARALLNKPNIILCDEPTGNLDGENRNQIVKILQDINSQGVSIILVTHDPELAKYGNKKFVLNGGKLIHHSTLNNN
ncbi:putative ABC transport system ATP-binding protein [Amphibacillus marinus]|uniref:Putative ABC transport system ATP-binding protein n=1 Tax=Amphibacillus marinus TaxID=872970 RepID=A0A1H8I3X6_9BACI|nr:ABC transporter ATP-binding protein [Amphibacillus marinus]SEN62736.1 putative ABC transport system ATP-binding protein [Amphibacillus marinus]